MSHHSFTKRCCLRSGHFGQHIFVKSAVKSGLGECKAQASGERAEDTAKAVTEYTRSAHPTAMTSPDQLSCESGLSTTLGLDAQCETGTVPRRTGSPWTVPDQFKFIREISSSSGLKSRNSQNSLNFFSNSGVCWRSAFLGRIATYWAELMRRTLAPLRKIVARELEVFEFRRNSVHPQSFAIHDHMECGHVHTSLLWDIFDLLNAYTESPHVRAIRHRCRECLTLTAKKPVQSVTLAKAKVA